MEELMLTTVDNPFDPFDQYDEWLKFDEDKGYFTNNVLARVALVSNDLPDESNQLIVNEAVKDIAFNCGLYKIVRRTT